MSTLVPFFLLRREDNPQFQKVDYRQYFELKSTSPPCKNLFIVEPSGLEGEDLHP